MDSVRELMTYLICPERKGRVVLALVLLAGASVSVAAVGHSTLAGVIGATLFVAAIGLHRHGEPAASDEANEALVSPLPPVPIGSINPMTGAWIAPGAMVDSLGCPRGFEPKDFKPLDRR